LVSFMILWGPVVAHMALLFIASATPDTGTLTETLSDKLLHIAAYVPLGFLVLRALSGGRLAAITWPRALAAVAISVLYGVSDEIHQMFVPGRTADPLDIVADAIGATLGVMALASLKVVRKVYFDDPGTGRFPF
jgi:VanZ family protein